MKKTTLKAMDNIASALFHNGGTIDVVYQKGRQQHTTKNVMTLVGAGGDYYKSSDDGADRIGPFWGSTGQSS